MSAFLSTILIVDRRKTVARSKIAQIYRFSSCRLSAQVAQPQLSGAPGPFPGPPSQPTFTPNPPNFAPSQPPWPQAAPPWASQSQNSAPPAQTPPSQPDSVKAAIEAAKAIAARMNNSAGGGPVLGGTASSAGSGQWAWGKG